MFVEYQNASLETDGYANLLDNTDNIVYVIDRKTFELYYANDAAFNYWHRDNYNGMKCYEFTRGRKEPCPWCSIFNMIDGHYYTDSTYDPEKNKYYRIRCDNIMWYGREAVTTFAVDVTEDMTKLNTLETERSRMDTIISSIPIGIVVNRVKDGKVSFVAANDQIFDEWEIDHV